MHKLNTKWALMAASDEKQIQPREIKTTLYLFIWNTWYFALKTGNKLLSYNFVSIKQLLNSHEKYLLHINHVL